MNGKFFAKTEGTFEDLKGIRCEMMIMMTEEDENEIFEAWIDYVEAAHERKYSGLTGKFTEAKLTLKKILEDKWKINFDEFVEANQSWIN